MLEDPRSVTFASYSSFPVCLTSSHLFCFILQDLKKIFVLCYFVRLTNITFPLIQIFENVYIACMDKVESRGLEVKICIVKSVRSSVRGQRFIQLQFQVTHNGIPSVKIVAICTNVSGHLLCKEVFVKMSPFWFDLFFPDQKY